MANFFSNLFKKQETQPSDNRNLEMVNNSTSTFSRWTQPAYENEIFRSAIDSIAKHTGKLKPVHLINDSEGNADFNKLLQFRPNPYMNTYDFLYKVTTHYFIYNNAYIYIQRDMNGNPIAYYPILANTVEFGTNSKGDLYTRFVFKGGFEVYMPYADVIHLRRHFNNNDLIGDSNSALDSTLEVSHTQNEGMVNSIKIGASIRGILQYTSVANDVQLAEKRTQFVKEYLNIDNSGGVAVIDSKSNYTPIDSKPYIVDQNQLIAIENKIYAYLGIHRNVINGNYTEDQWSSFYESTIEPIALQLSLEFTNKSFTATEIKYGHKITFDSKRLQFSSNSTKIRLVGTLMPSGLLTVNQALEVLNLPRIDGEEGDKRLQTLNYVDMAQANKYQGVDENERNQNSEN